MLVQKQLTQFTIGWVNARANGKTFVIAINAAVLLTLYHNYPEFSPIKQAYEQMSNAVVFHNEEISSNDVVVFDLSKREILTADILRNAVEKLTAPIHYKECIVCPLKESCEVHKNCRLLNNQLFQDRLSLILERVSLAGYHATLREIQGFISYLIFGDRSCAEISRTAGNNDYFVANLVFSGKGKLFNAIRNALDPINISHPVWDEKILLNDISSETWADGCEVPAEAIAFDNDAMFKMRKRQFFFFNENGEELLKILDDDVSHFQSFLVQDDKKIIKELVRKLNTFFGATKSSNSELQIWSGHRYDNEPRKVLISTGALKSSAFKLGHPTLLKCMRDGIDMTANYIRLEKKDDPSIFLKIDFEMYMLMTEAERGVPVLFMESDLVKKVWRFIEQLQSNNDTDDDDITISLLDVQNKKRISIMIDTEDKKYTVIDAAKSKEER